MNGAQSRQVLGFFALAVLISWMIWVPLAVFQVNVRQVPWFYLMAFGGASPSLVGIAFILKTRTYTQTEFLRSVFSCRAISLRNLALLVLSMVVPFAISMVLDYFIFGNMPAIAQFTAQIGSPLSAVAYFFSLVYGGPITEEFGWRGFAARQIQPRLGIVRSGAVIGMIWSVWHYPLLFLNGQYQIDNYLIYIPVHLLKHIGLAILIAYFYAATGYSLLSAILIHFLSNMLVNLFLPVPITATAINGALLLFTGVLLVRFLPVSNRLRPPESS